MNKKYFYLLALFVVFIGGYCIGKYNNSQRYLFHSQHRIIIDTYTGTTYFGNKSKKLINNKPPANNEVQAVEEAN